VYGKKARELGSRANVRKRGAIAAFIAASQYLNWMTRGGSADISDPYPEYGDHE